MFINSRKNLKFLNLKLKKKQVKFKYVIGVVLNFENFNGMIKIENIEPPNFKIVKFTIPKIQKLEIFMFLKFLKFYASKF